MLVFEDTKTTISTTNLTNVLTRIYVKIKDKGTQLMWGAYEDEMTEIPWTKYKIKETDMRVKTASFTSPMPFDLTTGVHLVKIVTPLHENFVGEILDDEVTENSDGTFTYQCQDMSREYQSKYEVGGNLKIYQLLQFLITKGGVSSAGNVSEKTLNGYKHILSGLRPIGLYQPSLWGNTISTNMMEQSRQLMIRNTTYIQAIRDICNSMGYVDVYFDSNGVIQIEPISLKDWQNTGLYLTSNQTSSRKFKFDTTNAITEAIIYASDKTKGGTAYGPRTILGLDLEAFFGVLVDVAENPVQANDPVAETTTTKKTTTTNTNSNPYNNRAKKVLVSADGGSGDFKNGIVKLLKNDGWTVTDLGVGPGTHSTSYNKLSSSYAVNLTIYNGCDPETIKEPVTGWLKGKHEKNGVALVQMFDTSSWTNPKGMKPYRYGDFAGYTCHKAWDDNYSGKSDAQAKIDDLLKWYKTYRNQVSYCCGPTPAEAYAQFKAGGYLKYKGL